MREIKFRGMTINGEWVYGLLCKPTVYKYKGMTFISNQGGMPMAYEVRPETVGEYTGLKDKTSKEIYEGDIVKFLLPDWTWSNPQMVQYCHSSFVTKSGNLWGLGFDPDIVHDEKLEYLEVIGNIYENPELLEVVK